MWVKGLRGIQNQPEQTELRDTADLTEEDCIFPKRGDLLRSQLMFTKS